MTTVVLIGTLDTKGAEYAFVRDQIEEDGLDTLLIDAGIMGKPQTEPDVDNDEVAEAAGTTIAELRAANDRGAAIEAMARGGAVLINRLFEDGRLHGIIGLGGSGGSALVASVMRNLPVGVPKLLVSTVAGGDTRPYVGDSDLTLMPSIVDIAGINRISAQILANAAGAISGMALAHAEFTAPPSAKPLIGATMFGVTTPCVTRARERLEEAGYEVLVFHATGTGGQAMERLIADGYIAATLDSTTTELADELVGGVMSAGPDRLTGAARAGIPQVVSLGALDMVNFGPRETVPEQFHDRLLYQHNPTVTLMRTTPTESAELGRRIATRLNESTGPVTLFIPLRGVSVIATEGQLFHDPAADAALFDAVRSTINPEVVEVREMDLALNDPAFADAMADRLIELYQAATAEEGRTAQA